MKVYGGAIIAECYVDGKRKLEIEAVCTQAENKHEAEGKFMENCRRKYPVGAYFGHSCVLVEVPVLWAKGYKAE